MNKKSNSSEVRFTEEDHEIVVVGDLNELNASAFAANARGLAIKASTPFTLNLSGLDIDDGVALAICVNVLRELRYRASRVVLRGAPQMLGHNLYRVGMLEGPAKIELIDMRLDEPTGF